MKLGALIYRLFKKQIDREIFLSQTKIQGFEKLQYVFMDSNGKKYYRYGNDLDIPILRKGELERVLLEIESGLSSRELDMLIESGEAALTEQKGDRMVPNLAKIGFIFQEIKNRKKLLIHPELLFESVALLYIREDEDPTKVDKDILNQKMEQFKLDSKDGLRDFFYMSPLKEYIPFLERSEEEFLEYYREGIVKMKAMEKQIKSFLGQELLTT